MTVTEAYNTWKKDPCNKWCLCKHGIPQNGGDGFGYCNCESHQDVYYGGKYCSPDCKDFERRKGKRNYRYFLFLYKNDPYWYNEIYNIDKKSKGYIPDDWEEEEQEISLPERKIAETSSKIKEIDGKFFCCQCSKTVGFMDVFCKRCGTVLDWADYFSNLSKDELDELVHKQLKIKAKKFKLK